MANKEYSEEELIYFRVCYITTHIIREGLKELFKREWDRHHSHSFGLWQDTGRNGQDFFRMESKKSRSKNSRLLSIIQNGNTEEWDSTCFFFAILYSDTLGSLIGTAVANDVDDLRLFRNQVFAHCSKACFPEAEFQRCVSKVSNAFTSLNLATVELQRIINQTSFLTGELQMIQEQVKVLEDEIQGKPKSFMILPQAPSHKVVERKVEVALKTSYRNSQISRRTTRILLLLRFTSLVIQDVAKVKLLVKLAGSFLKEKTLKTTMTVARL